MHVFAQSDSDEQPEGHTAVDDMEHDEHEGLDDASLKEHEEVTKIKARATLRAC